MKLKETSDFAMVKKIAAKVIDVDDPFRAVLIRRCAREMQRAWNKTQDSNLQFVVGRRYCAVSTPQRASFIYLRARRVPTPWTRRVAAPFR
jgi:hypothetical protein